MKKQLTSFIQHLNEQIDIHPVEELDYLSTKLNRHIYELGALLPQTGKWDELVDIEYRFSMLDQRLLAVIHQAQYLMSTQADDWELILGYSEEEWEELLTVIHAQRVVLGKGIQRIRETWDQ